MADRSDRADRNATTMPKPHWRYASYEGSRLAMLQRNLTLTVKERLEEMQALNELGAGIRQTKKR